MKSKSLPYTIQLAGPWACTLEKIGSPNPLFSGTLSIPGGWKSLANDQPVAKAHLRRTFQWVGPTKKNERVFLILDGIVGPAHLTLNGQSIRAWNSPWALQAIDITNHLRAVNEILLTLTIENPSQPGGIWGGVWLSIDADQVQITRCQVTTHWKKNASAPENQTGLGTLNLQAKVQQGQTTPTAWHAKLFLDDVQILDQDIPLENSDTFNISLRAENLPAMAWNPRGLGLPYRQQGSLRLYEKSSAHERTRYDFTVGFRTVEDIRVLENQKGFVKINGQVLQENVQVLDAERGLLPTFGEDYSQPMEHWKIANPPLLGVAGHFPRESLLDCCDRAGILVLVDRAFFQKIADQDQRPRPAHPCLFIV